LVPKSRASLTVRLRHPARCRQLRELGGAGLAYVPAPLLLGGRLRPLRRPPHITLEARTGSQAARPLNSPVCRGTHASASLSLPTLLLDAKAIARAPGSPLLLRAESDHLRGGCRRFCFSSDASVCAAAHQTLAREDEQQSAELALRLWRYLGECSEAEMSAGLRALHLQ